MSLFLFDICTECVIVGGNRGEIMDNELDNEYFRKFQEDISKVWIKKLINSFNEHNRLVFSHLGKELEVPNFAFNFSKSFWGMWSHKDRVLSLSYYLFRNLPWELVEETIKHEMAHMIVSDIWGDISDNGNSHGELFRKACLVMGIDDKARHSFDDKINQVDEKNRVMDKVHKLFCLGESNHKAESELAISKAYELMTKYNISNIEGKKERVFISRPVGLIWSKVPHYINILSNIISDNYFVKHIYCTYQYGYGRQTRYIEFFGEAHNLDIAEYVFHFLLLEGERQWLKFKESDTYKNRHQDQEDFIRKHRVYSKGSFLEGFYRGFRETLEKKDKQLNVEIRNQLPVLKSDTLLSEKYKDHYHPCNWGGGGGSNGLGYGEGASIGKRVKIRQGISYGGIGGKILIEA